MKLVNGIKKETKKGKHKKMKCTAGRLSRKQSPCGYHCCERLPCMMPMLMQMIVTVA